MVVIFLLLQLVQLYNYMKLLPLRCAKHGIATSPWRGNYWGSGRQSIRDRRFERIPIEHKLAHLVVSGRVHPKIFRFKMSSLPRLTDLREGSKRWLLRLKLWGRVCRDNWGFEFLDWHRTEVGRSQGAAIGRQLFQNWLTALSGKSIFWRRF